MKLLFRMVAILFGCAILYLSLQPAGNTVGPLHADKVQHFLAYGALTFLTAFGWPKLRLTIVVIMAIVFGIGIEIAQGLGGQGRMPSVLDAVANGVGAAISALFVRFIRKSPRFRSA
jgi:VanZ family protein